MTLAPQHAFDDTASPGTGYNGSPIAQEGRFVINLCSVRRPSRSRSRAPALMKYASSQPLLGEAAGHRLHMGYFQRRRSAEVSTFCAEFIQAHSVGEAPAEQPDPLGYTEIFRILERRCDLLSAGGGARGPVQAPRGPERPPPASSSENASQSASRHAHASGKPPRAPGKPERSVASEFDIHDES